MSISIEISGNLEAEWKLSRLHPKIQRAAQRALKKCGFMAMLTAKDFAPVSPTMSLINSTLKRKKRTTRRPHPGGLEKSIMFDTTATEARVFVPENGYTKTKSGYNYAKRIHDEKGVTWRNRGPGTIAKGPQADEKFIERAIKTHEQNGDFTEIFEDEVGKAVFRL